MLVSCGREAIAAFEAEEVPVGFNRRFGSIVAVVFLCFFARPLDCLADKVVLKSGQEVEGLIIDKNPGYIILYANGESKVYPVADIDRIVEAEFSSSTSEAKGAEPTATVTPASDLCASTDACYALGDEALSRHEAEKAIKYFDEAIRFDPQNANAYLGRGKAHMMKDPRGEDQAKEYSEILKDANEVVRLDPANAHGWALRAYVLLKLDRPDEAIVDNEKAMALAPYMPHPYKNRAKAYGAKGEYDKAIRDVSIAISLTEVKPHLCTMLNDRAGFYLKKGDLSRAELDCDRVVQLDPSFPNVYARRAQIFAARKEYDQAWALVNKAQELGVTVDPVFLEELKKNASPS